MQTLNEKTAEYRNVATPNADLVVESQTVCHVPYCVALMLQFASRLNLDPRDVLTPQQVSPAVLHKGRINWANSILYAAITEHPPLEAGGPLALELWLVENPAANIELALDTMEDVYLGTFEVLEFVPECVAFTLFDITPPKGMLVRVL